MIPTEPIWLNAVLSGFADDPALAIVGGFMGFDSFHPDPANARPIWDERPYRFVHHANIGPFFLRRHAYEQLGGWDYSFSEPGEPGICFESELCLRAWVTGSVSAIASSIQRGGRPLFDGRRHDPLLHPKNTNGTGWSTPNASTRCTNISRHTLTSSSVKPTTHSSEPDPQVVRGIRVM